MTFINQFNNFFFLLRGMICNLVFLNLFNLVAYVQHFKLNFLNYNCNFAPFKQVQTNTYFSIMLVYLAYV